jgi:hypothetical protein
MKMDLKKGTLFALRRTSTTRYARLQTFCRTLNGMKKSDIELFFTSATSTENIEEENVSNQSR